MGRKPLLALLLGLAWAAPAPAADRIVPLHERVFLAGHPRWSSWSVPIQAADGSTQYVLSLEPQASARHRVTAVTLALRFPGEGKEAANLLAPPGGARGLQPYSFSANDLAQGVEQSTLGKSRRIFASRVNLVLRATLLEAGVKPLSKGQFELDKLSVQIDVDNPAR